MAEELLTQRYSPLNADDIAPHGAVRSFGATDFSARKKKAVITTVTAGVTRIADSDFPVVVAGGGPVGIRVAQELSRLGHDVIIFNSERWQPYNRVKLSPFLCGEVQLGQILLPEKFDGPGDVKRYDAVSVVDIDKNNRVVTTSNNKMVSYSKLILALGSHAHIPNISGSELDGVYKFRNFDDTEALVARSLSARSIVVIGGGLLGLEAARGMSRKGTSVTVVEHESRLMPRQLDNAGAQYLQQQIRDLGIRVITGINVEKITGSNRVESVTLGNATELPADTVIFCTGVRANIQLPSQTGLAFGKGVTVNENLQTSDPNIYAIGECAEYKGHVYGLVGPGFEQAKHVAQHIRSLVLSADTMLREHKTIASKPSLYYEGSVPASKLKILGVDIFSMGDFETLESTPGIGIIVFDNPETNTYRRLLLSNRRIVAAVGVGEWREASRIQQLIASESRVWRWQLVSFRRHGELLRGGSAGGVLSSPDSNIVCNCTGTSKGVICAAIQQGAVSIEAVRSQTSANTVCGSCEADVRTLLGNKDAAGTAVKAWKVVIQVSCVAMLLAAATYFIPPVPLADTFIPDDRLRDLWFNTDTKLWSGYSLLALTVAASALGLRKRVSVFRQMGSYGTWRIVHLSMGLFILLVLFAHTGFRLGENLNRWMMLSFLLSLVFGSIAGLMTGSEHKLKESSVVSMESKPRSLPTWLHLLALWPLPVLLVIHVLTVYTY